MIAADNARVYAGDPVLTVSPNDAEVWEALRALYLIGTADDLADINRYARGSDHHMSDRIAQQAKLTLERIKRATTR